MEPVRLEELGEFVVVDGVRVFDRGGKKAARASLELAQKTALARLRPGKDLTDEDERLLEESRRRVGLRQMQRARSKRKGLIDHVRPRMASRPEGSEG